MGGGHNTSRIVSYASGRCRALTRTARVVAVLLSLAPSTAIIGCSPITVVGHDGAVHYLVLGVGLVSIPGPDDADAVLAVRSRTLGLQVSDQPGVKFVAGYAHSSVVAVPTSPSDVTVEVSQRPLGPISVSIRPAKEDVQE